MLSKEVEEKSAQIDEQSFQVVPQGSSKNMEEYEEAIKELMSKNNAQDLEIQDLLTEFREL